MIWNILSGEDRLHRWKQLRINIKDLSLDQQLLLIADFYSKMPRGARSLDYYNPAEWPTPWEILFHGSFCISSISLLIFYTLTLVDIEHKVELYLIEDSDGVYLLPIIDDQFVLNYQLGSVNNYSEISDNFTVLQKYPKEQIKSIT